MAIAQGWHISSALAPMILMVATMLFAQINGLSATRRWGVFQAMSTGALIFSVIALVGQPADLGGFSVLQASPLGLTLAVLVQVLGTVIGSFSSRYLAGEAGQQRYVIALAGVLASVHLLLIANHWLVLIAAWACIGVALQGLLCFYPDRPFARLVAHKKQIADRLADLLLLIAAGFAWASVGSGSLSALWDHLALSGMSASLQTSAVALTLAVVLRCALLPVHGLLIQVMEAPTPVSALLHAGVVNLGGFVLIRFAPLLEQATFARALLLCFGLTTAFLAGMVMLTRISIKVRLAWSTVAQMGFMLLECAVGLYTLAALHLIGHSLYKAHTFLSASTIVRQTSLRALHQGTLPTTSSVVAAPLLTIPLVLLIQSLSDGAAWPAWWSVVLALAWAPLLWWGESAEQGPARLNNRLSSLLLVAGLTAITSVAHGLPLGLQNAPHQWLGLVALLGMGALYLGLAVLQRQPAMLSRWRRWSYAGFYLDEVYTRLALQHWPTHWLRGSHSTAAIQSGERHE